MTDKQEIMRKWLRFLTDMVNSFDYTEVDAFLEDVMDEDYEIWDFVSSIPIEVIVKEQQ